MDFQKKNTRDCKMAVTMTKLAMAAVLGACAVFLGTLTLTLQLLVVQRKQQLVLLENKAGKVKQPASSRMDDEPSGTVTHSVPTSTDDLFLWKKEGPEVTSKRYAGIAYWNQVKRHLGELGDVTALGYASYGGGSPPPSSHIHASLVQAVEHGHSEAQHYMASALASGIWLTGHEHNGTMPEDFAQVTAKTMLLWHMAALDGNAEAAMALGHRVQTKESDCMASLPYFQVAADASMDQLEADMHSRGKVSPPLDRHSLPEIHLHGGTSSQLTWDNKPDESLEAIQYYHLLSVNANDPDLHAAYTLAHLYHFGARGVQQNLTQALFYYEIAAKLDHWEAAGQAGKFHFWGLGMEASERNVLRAHKLFLKGAPLGLEGCRDRHRQALKVKTKGQSIEDTEIKVCDHPSLNGLGLLYLYGVPMVLAVDTEKARGYFQLARDMGNMDASYNLVMLRLGFKSGWKEFDKVLGGRSQSVTDTVPSFMEKPENYPSKEDWQFATQELQSASSKGHTQARHRLAMIYQYGVKVGAASHVNKDCRRAVGLYKGFLLSASPNLSDRTRTAYKQYVAGDYEGALVNYLMAAETGHALSQVNAAFLLESGVCLHLTNVQCRKASLRFWKAAAQSGDAEAALRVGDFYYFGSKRPVTWIDCVLFPEVHLLPTVMKYGIMALDYVRELLGLDEDSQIAPEEPVQECEEVDEAGVCLNPDAIVVVEEEAFDADWSKAAHYYRLASQQHKSARANYNLGYMHEWGLGLTQDFPLAKRHYDLSKAGSKQAELAVQIALMTMNLHEQVKQMQASWKKWNQPTVVEDEYDEEDERRRPPPRNQEVTKLDVIVKHLVSWESVLIILLTLVLSRILQYRRT